MNWCCGPDGRPDFDKMMRYMARHDRASKFDAAGWALFFIWVGIAWLAEVSIAVGLLGVAAITLGMQAIRKISGVRVEGFWVLVGLGFAVAGSWQWFDVGKPLAPLVLIAIGVALLVWRVRPWSRHSDER
ncbi:MAG: hypothetical protein WBM80_08215 [Woeseiaceae bacterium]